MTTSLTLANATVYPHLESKEANRIKRREILGEKGLVGCNATSSLADECLNIYRDRDLNTEEKKQLADWKFILNRSKDAIEQHFEKRVSQMFLQAVLCYNSDYIFREGHTIHQGLGAHNLNDIKFNAAHHATIPCLYAKSKTTNKEVVFLYRSGFYDESNATIDLVREVNEADRAIDEKHKKSSFLRRKAVSLLNKVSWGWLSPPQAIKKFLDYSIIEIDKAIAKENNNKVVDVLKLYRQHAENLIDYVNDPNNIDLWLNLQIEDPIVVNKDMTYQSLIKKKVNDLPFSILRERHKDLNESHTPYHFQDLYHHWVLSQFQDEELKVLEKALDINFEKLDEKIKNFSHTKKTEAFIEKHAEKIDELKNEIILLLNQKQDNPIKEESFEFSTTKKICLRPSIYRLRYEMLSEDQKVQSKIKSLFDSTLNKVKNGKSLPHFDDFFYHFILNEVPEESDKLILAKLLNVSPTALKQKIREVKVNANAHAAINEYASALCRLSEFNKVVKQICDSTNCNKIMIITLCQRRFHDQFATVYEKVTSREYDVERIDKWISQKSKDNLTEQEINKNSEIIRKAIQDAFNEISELNEKTRNYKAKLLCELRKASGMTQNNFLEKYKKKFTSMTNAKLIDYEKGRVEINLKMAERFAEIYGVSPTLFSPSHFAERQTA